MRILPVLLPVLLLALLLVPPATARGERVSVDGVVLEGEFRQGGLVRGIAAPGTEVTFEGRRARVSPGGVFLIGFTRDAPATATLTLRHPDGRSTTRTLAVTAREYDIQRLDGLPDGMVTPPPAVLARIKVENAAIADTRRHDLPETLFESGWIWPAQGRISGVYGSQRILNGEPRWPHYGVDIAAPVGTPVVAPADALVTLVHNDMYFSGGTIILDHGHGLTSAMLHLSRIDVKAGQRVRQGQLIGAIGQTGRTTGPHLDWRINLFDARIDPALLVPPMPAPGQ